MNLTLLFIFIIGYAAIAMEHTVRINKAATALITGVLCWVVLIRSHIRTDAELSLQGHLGDISQILFFLLGAMTIVELIDAHDGFDLITKRISTLRKGKLLWIIGLLSFFLSALLDNLTTSIVMVTLVRKLVASKEDRWMLAGLIVIAANAGGAWSPIGDVTTTMLWIGNQVTALNIIKAVFIPSLISLLVPLLLMRLVFRGQITTPMKLPSLTAAAGNTTRDKSIVLYAGILLLFMIPVFKSVTHLPPFMGILASLGILWIITEIIHSGKDEADREQYSVAYALRKIDTPSILFFLGILLAISALETSGELRLLAGWMDDHLQTPGRIATSVGLLSAVVDNVPLVAATQGMYDLQHFPTDHSFWEFLAYTTGTGGSILIIGSAAGVAAMGLEQIPFMWYLKRVGWLALAGYFAGAAVYILQNTL